MGSTGWGVEVGRRGRGLDLRQSPRKPFAAQVRLTLPDREPLTYLSTDLGRGGIFLRSLRPLAPGTRVGVSFHLPNLGRFSCLADVAWTTPSPAGADARTGMGLRFAPLHADDLSPLARYLETDPNRRRVLILEDDLPLREALEEGFSRHGMTVTGARWEDAEVALAYPHGLLVLGADRPGLAAAVVDPRSRVRRVALVGFVGGSAEWHPYSAFCFTKPVDPEQVARLSLALLR